MPVFKSIFPFTLEIFAEHELMNDAMLDECLSLSEKAFANWHKTSFRQRSDLMLKAAEILLLQRDPLAELATKEMGKIIKESKAEVDKCATVCKYYAGHAEEFLKNVSQNSDAKKTYVRFDPVGTILAIMPWNFPYWQVFRFAASYIMAGNVVLLKHAPNVCSVAKKIESIFIEAGFPKGVFQTLIIDTDKVEKIISHDAVHGVTLTGSELAGASVAALAGKQIKKTVLELGGSDAFIILEDADIEKAAKIATISRMQNAGQSCIAAKRFIAVKKIIERFEYYFRQNIEALKTGDPFDENINVGPLARIDLAEKIEKQLNQSLQLGATLILGGKRDRCTFQPALLSGVQKQMSAYDQETFGPLAAIILAEDENDAIRIANDSRYGLASSLWTKDIDKAERIASEINAGAVFINSMVKSDPRYPFGGIKRSGYGRELSSFGIHEFMNIKTVLVEE